MSYQILKRRSGTKVPDLCSLQGCQKVHFPSSRDFFEIFPREKCLPPISALPGSVFPRLFWIIFAGFPHSPRFLWSHACSKQIKNFSPSHFFGESESALFYSPELQALNNSRQIENAFLLLVLWNGARLNFADFLKNFRWSNRMFFLKSKNKL